MDFLQVVSFHTVTIFANKRRREAPMPNNQTCQQTKVVQFITHLGGIVSKRIDKFSICS